MRAEMLDLNLLRALNALLQEKSVSRAAHRLHVTQQAMSYSLRRLREHFNDQLLIRVGPTLKPTTLGEALTDPVRELNLQIIATLETRAIFDPKTSSREFRLVMSDYAALSLLPNLMADLAVTAPNLVCDFEPLRAEMFGDLVLGKIDFCVLPTQNYFPGDAPTEGIRTLALYSDDFVCIIDKDHPTIGSSMTRQQYLSGSHNLLSVGGGTRSMIEEAWFVQKLRPRVSARCGSVTNLIWMLAGTSLIATAQRRLAARFLQSHPIRVVECPIAIPRLEMALQWHVRNDNDPAHRFLRESLVSAARAGEGV